MAAAGPVLRLQVSSGHYGRLAGHALADAVRADGYDGIVTTEGDAYTREIVSLIRK